jgi:hypothetical protein
MQTAGARMLPVGPALLTQGQTAALMPPGMPSVWCPGVLVPLAGQGRQQRQVRVASSAERKIDVLQRPLQREVRRIVAPVYLVELGIGDRRVRRGAFDDSSSCGWPMPRRAVSQPGSRRGLPYRLVSFWLIASVGWLILLRLRCQRRSVRDPSASADITHPCQPVIVAGRANCCGIGVAPVLS